MGIWELAQLITALSLSLVAIILGYVFPKSQGSLNETTSLLLLFIVFVLVSLLTNRSFGWLILIVLVLLHLLVIKKVRNEKNSKYLGSITVIYLLVLVIETLWELFHTSRTESTKVTTLLGITIDNRISKHEISTTFGLTIKVLVLYLLLLLVVYILTGLFGKRKYDY